MGSPKSIGRCINCDYDLTGLARDALCPECSTPVEQSIQSRLLRTADPAYVRALYRGASLLTWTFIGLGVIFLLGMVTPGPRGGSPMTSAVIAVTTTCTILAVWARGWWLVTTPDPRRPAALGPDTLRRLVRAGAWGMAALACLLPLLLALGLRSVHVPDAARLLLFFFYIAAILGLLATGTAYIGRISRQLDDPAMTVLIRCLVLIGYPGLVITIAATAIFQTNPLGCAAGAWILATFFAHLLIFSSLQTDLKSELAKAASTPIPQPTQPQSDTHPDEPPLEP